MSYARSLTIFILVDEVDGDNVVISWTSPEKWVSSYCVHRNTLLCEARHTNAMEICQDEFHSLTNRLGHSPMAHVVQDAVRKVPEQGLVQVGAEAVKGGMDLFGRWLENGIGTVVEDIKFAANLDGRHNPGLDDSLDTEPADEQHSDAQEASIQSPLALENLELDSEELQLDPIPNMPACPITGIAMSDPVVAADGHTYERKAIARWLQTSDKSPLTGMVLPHKNLVTNYMLMSSLQEAAVLSVDDEAEGASLEEINVDLVLEEVTEDLALEESFEQGTGTSEGREQSNEEATE